MNKWIAKSGLMNLQPKEDALDCDNDNGILFRAYFEYLYLFWNQNSSNEPIKAKEIRLTIKKLERVPGLHMRNPGRTDNASSHDNTLGIVSLCVLFRIYDVIEDIIQYGLTYGFTFDARYPYKTDYTRWRQGSDVAFYKLCSDRVPMPWELLWMFGAQIYASFIDRNNSSSHLTNWLRFKTLEQLQNQTNKRSIKLIISFSMILKEAFKNSMLAKTNHKGIEAMFEMYFTHKEHPNQVLSKGLEF